VNQRFLLIRIRERYLIGDMKFLAEACRYRRQRDRMEYERRGLHMAIYADGAAAGVGFGFAGAFFGGVCFPHTVRFTSSAGLNRTLNPGGITSFSLVWGLTPFRSAVAIRSKIPKPVSLTFFPFSNVCESHGVKRDDKGEQQCPISIGIQSHPPYPRDVFDQGLVNFLCKYLRYFLLLCNRADQFRRCYLIRLFRVGFLLFRSHFPLGRGCCNGWRRFIDWSL
jgi:hypothetical protein